jgi:spermidine synthase
MDTRLAGTLVFLSSGAVLLIEILAGRLLAPYVGVTLQTFTAVIGVVLAGIALGTWLGGKAADRTDPRRLIGPELFFGGLAALLAYPTVRTLGPELVQSGDAAAVVLLAGLVTFFPAALLSAVNPAVVKAVLGDLEETGRVVGRLSALGTLGAITGTFSAGFFLVAALPTSVIVLLVGVILCLVGAATWYRWSSRRSSALLGLVPAGLLGVATLALPHPCDIETAYSCARIEERGPTGRLLVLDTVPNSYVDLADPQVLAFTYTRMFAAVVDAYTSGPVDLLHIGGGGFTMPRWTSATRPGSRNVAIEIDPALVELARRHLALDEVEGLEVLVGDARVLLPRLSTDGFDVVLGDGFSGIVVPWHLTTVEFAREIERVLTPSGVYVLNLIDRGDLDFVRSEIATLERVFDHVALVTLPERLTGGGNFVLVASSRPVPAETIRAHAREWGLDVVVDVDPDTLDAQPLVDDHAPVDQLLAS